MTEKENYPAYWQGEVPPDLIKVAHGKAEATISSSSCLEYLEHLTRPVYKALDGINVLDPACGTGEILLTMAAKYQQVSFTACDNSSAALELAQQYAEQLELDNIRFLNSLPDELDYDFILPTRPLQHMDDPAVYLANLHKLMAADGQLVIHVYTGSQPEENLYLQAGIAEMKAGQLDNEASQDLIKKLLALPLKESIDGLRECNQLMEKAGFKLFSGLHPRNYNPVSYLPAIDSRFLTGLSAADKAYVAEQFCGRFLRHSLLYTKDSYQAEMISCHDSQAAKYIPHLSPYAGASRQEERMIVGLKQQHMLLQEGIEFEDLSLPENLYRILPKLDGKMNCEQVHRRFLPLSWERFWALIQACWEEEIIYLHRPRTGA